MIEKQKVSEKKMLEWLNAVEELTERYVKNTQADRDNFNAIRAAIEGQPKVSREFVENYRARIEAHNMMLHCIEELPDILQSMLREAGIEVEEEK